MHIRTSLFGLISAWSLVDAATVALRGTTVTGNNIPTLGQEFFAGIPYAEPPVGRRRLQPPTLKTTLGSATFNATSYGPSCIQSNANAQLVSEDCLTINVLRPAGISQNASLDVLVWVYGGGFSGGTASIYNGSAIVASSVLRGTPVIYVNFNYRTGPLGFPQGTEAQQAGSLNLGLKDQLAALQWVQANIAAFGGDKRKVTVFGESAGAISIAIHMLRPTFRNLARSAILESGSWGTTITNFASAHQVDWDRFVAAVPSCASQNNSASIRCLQQANLSAEALQNATAAAGRSNTNQFPFIPTFDGTTGVYPTPGSIVLKSGNWSKIPFITGCNKDEGTAFIPFPQFLTNDASQVWVKSNFTPPLVPFVGYKMLNASTSRIAQLYPNDPAAGAPFGTGNETFGFNPEFKRLAALTTDISFHSQRRLFQKVATAQGVQSFGYHFIDPQPLPAFLGVTHGQEVNYVFGDCASKPLASQLLCQTMINYWLSFATSLTPNDGKGSARVNWPAYTSSSPAIIQLNGTNTEAVSDDYRKEQISYINENTIVFHQRRSDDKYQ